MTLGADSSLVRGKMKFGSAYESATAGVPLCPIVTRPPCPSAWNLGASPPPQLSVSPAKTFINTVRNPRGMKQLTPKQSRQIFWTTSRLPRFCGPQNASNKSRRKIARVTVMYPVRGYVKVIATGATGRVEERHEGSSKYLVEFNRNLSRRQWLTESELVGVSPALFFVRNHSRKLFYVAGRCIAFLFPVPCGIQPRFASVACRHLFSAP